MSDTEIKRSFVASKGHFTRTSNRFEVHLKAFSEDKSELNLKGLRFYLEQLQSKHVTLSEKGEELAMSEDK